MTCLTDAERSCVERIHLCFQDRASVWDMRARLVALHPPCFLRSFALRIIHHVLEHTDPKRLLDITLPSEKHAKDVCVALCAWTLLPYFLDQTPYDVPPMVSTVLAQRACRVGLHHTLVDVTTLLRNMQEVVSNQTSTRRTTAMRTVMICDILRVIVPPSSTEDFFEALFVLLLHLYRTLSFSLERDQLCDVVCETECFRHPLFCRSTKHVLKRIVETYDLNLSDERGLVTLLKCYAETRPNANRWVRSSFWSRMASEGFPDTCLSLVHILLSGPCKVPLATSDENVLMAKPSEWKVVQDVVRARRFCVSNATLDWVAFTTG